MQVDPTEAVLALTQAIKEQTEKAFNLTELGITAGHYQLECLAELADRALEIIYAKDSDRSSESKSDN